MLLYSKKGTNTVQISFITEQHFHNNIFNKFILLQSLFHFSTYDIPRRCSRYSTGVRQISVAELREHNANIRVQ
jgi:hypothetical protein